MPARSTVIVGTGAHAPERILTMGGLSRLVDTSDEWSRAPTTTRSIARGDPFIKMKGKEVFKLAVRLMEEAARDILEQHGLEAHQIGLVIPHQANLRIIEAIAQYLELPIDRFFVNVDRSGNTSAASIPIALDEGRRAGRIKPGEITLLVAFGAGLTYGSALIRW